MSRGVIDHCTFQRGGMTYNTPYGVAVSGYYEPGGERLTKLGTEEAVFIEDNYFLDLTHPAAAFGGGHYVVRNNRIIEKDRGTSVFPLDGHGPGFEDSDRGTRCMEIYNNFMEDQYPQTGQLTWRVIGPRSGGGVVFGNTFRNFRYTVIFTMDNTNTFSYNATNKTYEAVSNPDITKLDQYFFQYPPKSGKFVPATYPVVDQPHDYYIWDNTLENIIYGDTNDGVWIYGPIPNVMIQKDRDYFLHAPDGYTPYTYPHPLTLN